jgi:hypothetical protein
MWVRGLLFLASLGLCWAVTFHGKVEYISLGTYHVRYALEVPPRPAVFVSAVRDPDPAKQAINDQDVEIARQRQRAWDAKYEPVLQQIRNAFGQTQGSMSDRYFQRVSHPTELVLNEIFFRWQQARISAKHAFFELGDVLIAIAFAWILPLEWLALRWQRRVRNGVCPVCGYALTADQMRCPECGETRQAESEQPTRLDQAINSPANSSVATLEK